VPGASAPNTAAPCYTTGGAADPTCAAGDVANPYWNAPVQQLLDPNANYPVYDTFPGGIGAGGYSQFGAPFIGTLLVQYKHGPLAITPALQFFGGIRYGVPLSTPGVAPDSCTGVLGSAITGDPRYGYGAPGGSPYNAATCATASPNSGVSLAIPDPYTKAFDGVGAFVAPNQVLLHMQVTYQASKRLTLVANLANIYDRCFGGTKVAFAVANTCSYTSTNGSGGGITPIGNQYNPGDAIQPFLASPYNPVNPYTGAGGVYAPFAMFFEARLKI
jgi:hypothetical protein